jgi:hypothetical protein
MRLMLTNYDSIALIIIIVPLTLSPLCLLLLVRLDVNRKLIYEYRCDERLKAKSEGSTRLAYTGLCGGLEHLKIEVRLIDERSASVMGECEIMTLQVHRLYSK